MLITGAGPIGQMAAGVARFAGARHVVVTDTVEDRRTNALAMGASLAIEPGIGSLEAAMTELGMREGFDVGFEMSGHGAALDDLISVMNHGGRIALLGLYGRRPDIEMNALIHLSTTLVIKDSTTRFRKDFSIHRVTSCM